jgi:hypothetical protein
MTDHEHGSRKRSPRTDKFNRVNRTEFFGGTTTYGPTAIVLRGVMCNNPEGPHVVDSNLVKSCLPAKRGKDLTRAAQYNTKGALPFA